MKQLLFGAAFVLAIGGAFITKAGTLDKSGFTGTPANCQPAMISDDCLSTNTGELCLNQHLLSTCTDVLRHVPQP